jgi:hypothetical protein
MAQAISLSGPKLRTSFSMPGSIEALRDRQAEDITVKCEVTKKLKEEGRLECAKAAGWGVLGVAVVTITTLLGFKVAEFAGVAFVSFLVSLIPSPVTLFVGIIVAAAVMGTLLYSITQCIARPIFDKMAIHIERALEHKHKSTHGEKA